MNWHHLIAFKVSNSNFGWRKTASFLFPLSCYLHLSWLCPSGFEFLRSPCLFWIVALCTSRRSHCSTCFQELDFACLWWLSRDFAWLTFSPLLHLYLAFWISFSRQSFLAQTKILSSQVSFPALNLCFLSSTYSAYQSCHQISSHFYRLCCFWSAPFLFQGVAFSFLLVSLAALSQWNSCWSFVFWIRRDQPVLQFTGSFLVFVLNYLFSSFGMPALPQSCYAKYVFGLIFSFEEESI